MKRKVNSYWGQANKPVTDPPPPLFDKTVTSLALTPEMYLASPELKKWIYRYYKHRYVPEGILEELGISTEEL